ncbi:MAG: glycosyltransferase family 4 protein [Chloroflexota bacterium]
MARQNHAPHALLIVENLPVPFDRRVWAEAKALRAGGWRVSVIAPMHAGSKWHERLQDVNVYRYPVRVAGSGLLSHLVEYGVALPATVVLAALVHLRHRVDVIHVANPPDFFFPILGLFRGLGAAAIFDQHDPSPELHLAQGGRRGGVIDHFLRWCERRTYRAADVVIATNESMRGLATGRGGVDPARVVVVRSSVDPARTYRVNADASLKQGRDFLVVYLGVMGPQDGLDLFVRMARELADRILGKVSFMAVGDGSERMRSAVLAKSLGLEDDVSFPGRLPDDELRVVLSTADLAVGPDPANGFNELCTMNKTLEYMAMGVPVVSFDLAETRISAGDAAVYARPNDPADLARCAIEVLTELDRGAWRGQAGQSRMHGPLSWADSVIELRRAYDLALEARSAR